MRWEAVGTGNGGATDLTVEDAGSGLQLFVAYDQAVRFWTGTYWALSGGQGFDNQVYCVGAYDSPGSPGPTLYAGGNFEHTSQSQNQVHSIAKLVNNAWVSVGSGLPAVTGDVYALTVFDDGAGPKLFVAGSFATSASSGLNSNGIVRWDGTTWTGVGGGLTAFGPYPPGVSKMCVFDDGTGPALFVVGGFSLAGGTVANSIAKWNGSNWAALGSGLSFQGGSTGASGLAVFDDGAGPQLYVAGSFDQAGGVAANGVARWNGSGWSALPGTQLNPFSFARSLIVHDDGFGPALYLGFTTAFLGSSLIHGVARWDGQAWTALGGGYHSTVWGLASFDDGLGGGAALWACSTPPGIIGGNLPAENVARWYGGCVHRIDSMCFGDGTFAPCPCANYGASEHGCSNSASSQGAHLTSTGTLSPDTLVLQSAFEPATSPSLFLQASSLAPVQAAFGDGILCLGGQILRMYVKTASGGVAQAPAPTDPSITQRSSALGDPLAPGSVRLYQVFYRDPASGWCAPNTFNLSNGLRVVW